MEVAHVVFDFALLASGLVLVFKMQRQHAAERADLLDRLMSRDIVEYKTHTAPIVASDPVHVTDEEEWAREIEQMKSG